MSEFTSESDQLTPLVSNVLAIQDITWGSSKHAFVVRYRGMLTEESITAYDLLANDLKSHHLTPLFREEDGVHSISLIDRLPEPTLPNPNKNIILFILTLISMLIAGASYAYEGEATGYIELYRDLFQNLASGIPFAASLLAILLAHEFGHYLAGRYHKTAVTLPYFIPLPLPVSFGTMGAFIQMKEPPKNKRVLHDIGIAGPLAGLVVAIPLLLWGISLSEISPLPIQIPEGSGLMLEGNSIFYLFSKYIITGQLLPSPVDYQGVAPIIYWVKYLISGYPTPLGGLDIQMHSIAWAGWAGLLVTALNLIPVGQLDGGHILYVLFDKHVRKIYPFAMGLLILLGTYWSGWWFWAFMLFFMGRTHAEPLDQITKLTPGRKILSIATIVIFVLIFTPVPLRLISGPYFGP
ncbi:MAG: site-2 protease family protein [Chloroflexi bacterium]|jgi:membrane-associated protease RseP (regulator of RpoE activity)|nr:site-2 protease family protein [Chloroflexota bacterium]MBT3670535.1 site-2 protease family protein [Chloroflexota bacterium]MBT4304170.1 site-2 protease family protein [Chloroflexota bacterium]MBT4533471.1 site-2 protease family protein [Chloroflexota bacterium]MBT4683572.1 site-2 protease family protein [Chloroflexota bacterium]